MTTNKPEVVAYRYTASRSFGKRNPKWHYQESFPHAGNRKVEEIGRIEKLISLSDYEALQADYERLRKHLQNMIDQTTPLVPDPDHPGWSRRIQLDEVIAERDSLRAECDQLRKDAERYRWLRSHDRASDKQHECGMSPPGTVGMVFVSQGDGYAEAEEGDGLDAAIDAAMQGGQP